MNTEARPVVDLTKTTEQIQQTINALLSERHWIIDHYAAKIRELEGVRDSELENNSQNLSRLGYNSEDILPPVGIRPPLGTTRKLKDTQIKQLLSDFMKQGEEYASPVLTDYLGIAYRDFRKFVKGNSDFVVAKGKNKGRLYTLQINLL
jgi:hypothetical protein